MKDRRVQRRLCGFFLFGLIGSFAITPNSLTFAQESGSTEINQDNEKIDILWDSDGNSLAVGILLESETENGKSLHVISNYSPDFSSDVDVNLSKTLAGNDTQSVIPLTYQGIYASTYLPETFSLWTAEGTAPDTSFCFQQGTAEKGESLKAEFLELVDGVKGIYEVDTTVLDMSSVLNDDESAFIQVSSWNEDDVNIFYPGVLVNADGQCVGLIYDNGYAFCGWCEKVEPAETDESETTLVTETVTEATTEPTTYQEEPTSVTTTHNDNWWVGMPVEWVIAGGAFLLLLLILFWILIRLFRQDKKGPVPKPEDADEETMTLIEDEDEETKTILDNEDDE